MEKARRKSFRFGAVLMIVIVALFAVFTLTACQQGVQAKSIAVDEDTIPGVIVAGDTDWIGKVRILVTVSDDEDAEPVEISLLSSMIPVATRNDLKTPGEKTVTVYYQGMTTSFEVLVVEEGTETVTVTFYDKDNKKITAKTVVKGQAVPAPNPPDVDGQVFVEWVLASTSASATNALKAVDEDLEVKAFYSTNATYHTVTIMGPAGDKRGDVRVLHGNKVDLGSINVSVPDDYDASTLTWNPSLSTPITNNITIRMVASKKTKTVEYYYRFASGSKEYSLDITENVVIGGTVTMKSDAQNAITKLGLTFVEWQNTSDVVKTDLKYVAIVRDRTFTISYKNNEHTSQEYLAGDVVILPTTAKAPEGYTFNGQWKDAAGNLYTGTLTISQDLMLEPVFNKDSAPVKVIYNFSLRDPNSGELVVEQVYDNTTMFDDKIDYQYISQKLENIKSGNPLYDGFEIEKIEYDGRDVTSAGVRLGVIVGLNQFHEFTVSVINSALGTIDLTIVNGEVKEYTGTATGIYIPAEYDGQPVTKIGNNAFAGKEIARISIPDSVTDIGDNAFAGATFASDVTLPVIQVLGTGVFRNAKTVRLDDDEEGNRVYAQISVTFASGEESFLELPADTFLLSENIVSVTLPTGIKTIKARAFLSSDVAEINGLASVETVEGAAFVLTPLASLNLPKLKAYSNDAFTDAAHYAACVNDSKLLPEYADAMAANAALFSASGLELFSEPFAFMPYLTALSIGTETVYGEGESAFAFDFWKVGFDSLLATLTLGQGVGEITDGVADVASVGLTVLGTVNITDAMTEIDTDEIVDGLKNIESINVTKVLSSGAKYASDNGVLYFLGESAALILYPYAKGGDYTVPEKVGGKDVTSVSFLSTKGINTVTMNKPAVTAILATTPAATPKAPIVQNVIVSSDGLGTGETLIENIEKLRNYFYYVNNIFVSGKALTTAIVTENNWTDVKIVGTDDITVYDGTYGLVYEKVIVNKTTTLRILYGNVTATSIVIPASINNVAVTDIADGAFQNYAALQSLTIQARLKSFGSNVLKGATALENITVTAWAEKATVSADAFDDTAWARHRNLLVLGGKMIKYNNFAADESAGISTELTAEDFAGVTEIPNEFFKNMNNLTAVVLPASITKIGESAFAGSGIVSIDLAEVMTIGDNAFAGALYLEEIEIPKVGEMGKYVFNGCNGLKRAVILSKVNKGYLPVGTFRSCGDLEEVVFANGTLIGFAQDENGKSEAFEGCSSLSDVSFLATVAKIPASTFAECKSIQYLDFTQYAVTSIGEQAFSNCTGLEAIVIASKVTEIGVFAFSKCDLLKSVRFVANGGILAATHEAIDYDIFPVDSGEMTYTYKIYVASSASVGNISRYSARIVRELPKVDFRMYPNYAAPGALNLVYEETIYMDTAPVAPSFEGYEFDDWYYLQNDKYKKVEFPCSIVEDISFYARYFNISGGSIVERDLLLNEEEDTYALIGYENSSDDTAYIPTTFNDKQITEVYIGAFESCEYLTELVLPDSVKVIRRGTPSDTTATAQYLKKIVIPASVTEIEAGAFAGLADLDIVFDAGSELADASVASFVGTKWYTENKQLAENGSNNGFVIAGHLAIEYLGSSEDVLLPSDLYKLADGLFANNQQIKAITINNNLTYIGENCFTNATNLAFVSYSDESANNDADGGNKNSKLVYATAESFSGTAWMQGQDKAIIGTIFLKYNGLEGARTVVIPDYVTVINARAFEGDGTVEEIRFGNSSKLVSVGDYAFSGSKLTSINLPAVQKMGEGVFKNCIVLRTADLSKVTVSTLPASSFENCTALTDLVLSDSIELLGRYSLRNCALLENITANKLVKTDNFAENGLTSTAFYNREATDDAQYIVLGKVLVRYIPALSVEGDVIVATIPTGVEVVLAGVFNTTSITRIEIPGSVRVIEQNVFKDASSLTTVAFTVADGVAPDLTEIGDMAFYGATALTDFVLPAKLEKIGKQAFVGTQLTAVVLPDSVKTVEYKAFYNSALESVTVGAGVTFIGEEAFGSCDDLHKVTFDLDSDGLEELNANIETFVKAAVANEINLGLRDELDTYSLGDFKDHVASIFQKDVVAEVRTYVDSGLYNYINNSNDEKVKGWRNDTAKLFTKGDFPQVNFDNSGYYMPAMQTEVITELGTPAKTGHTFMGWYLSRVEGVYSNPLSMPYNVYVNTTIYAKWFENALASETSDEFSFLTNDAGDGYIVTAVTPTAETIASKILYVPSTVAGLPVVGIRLSADVTEVEKIVLTNASAFSGLEENIFYHFPNLKQIELRSDDGVDADMAVIDGVLYSTDGTVLIAYLVVYDEEENVATEFTVPSGVKQILPYAFDNSGLTKITIADTVTCIGEHAFNDELAEIDFALAIQLTDADSRSFDNTVWYLGEGGSVPAARTDYVVGGSTVGFFYSAGNLLIRYKQEAQTPELAIPTALKGFDVTVIAGYIYTEARTDGSVQDINFDRLVLPNKLTKINANAFAKVNVRINITTDSTVLNDIADDVFTHTTYYKNNNKDMIRLGNVLLKWISTAQTIVVPEGIVSISNDAFNSSQVQHLTLPSTLKYIGDQAFYNCTFLTSVSIPDSVVSIGKEAFAICSSLSSVTFNTGTSQLLEIGEKAFESCKQLRAVELPYRLETLGNSAFNNCTLLASVTFDYVTVENVDNVTITTLQAKSMLNELGENVFANCRALTSISLPNNITAIRSNAFTNCTSLTKVVFDVDLSKVTVIEKEAFSGCSKLGSEFDIKTTSVTGEDGKQETVYSTSLVTLILPNSLVRISEEAFKDCSSLYGIRINYNVRYIEKDVFRGCDRLTKIDVYSSTPASIENSSFDRGENAIFKLRIYVGNSPSGNVKSNYKRTWTTYANNIYERSEVPMLYFGADNGASTVKQSDGLEGDVFVNPSWKVGSTTWYPSTMTYEIFYTVTKTIVNGETIVETEPDNSAIRAGKAVSTGDYAILQGNNIVIVILDYDEVVIGCKSQG